MNKKVFIVFGGMLLYSFILVFGWRAYSLVRFDGVYSPMYVYGLSNPFKYYQKHIGSLLLKYGKEYKLKPTIDENNPETYSVYRNDKHGFEFKYPREYNLRVDDTFHSNSGDILIGTINKNSNIRCEILMMYKGWGVGEDWLPKKRYFNEHNLKSDKGIKYFISKNGQIILMNNNSILNKSNNIQYSESVEFIKNGRKKEFIKLYIAGAGCEKLTKNILFTFKFIE